MSYSPRTKLSCDSSACTVLTDGYVFVRSGLGSNQRMPLADWLIIADTETVREDFIPVEKTEPLTQAEAAEMPLPPSPQPVPETPAPIGTKWVWNALTLPEHNYRVAIKTRQGILQVKQVSCPNADYAGYEVSTERQMFETYRAWFETLPVGIVTKTESQDILSPMERRKKRTTELLADPTAENIKAIQGEWRVRSYVQYTRSINDKIEELKLHIPLRIAQLQAITFKDDMEDPSLRLARTRYLTKDIKNLSELERLQKLNPDTSDVRNAYMAHVSKNIIQIRTTRGMRSICYDSERKLIALKTINAEGKDCLLHYKSLKDIPGWGEVNPQITIHYRRQNILL